jgi:integrase
MIEHCRSRPDLYWLADVIIALACTGLRISELASVRWTDLDQGLTVLRLTDERASVRRRQLGTLRTTKGRRDRSLPVHPDLRVVPEALHQGADNRVFRGPRGGLLKPDTVRVILLREVITPLKGRFPTPPGEIGFEHGRVHSFRHYFCSQAFSGGASEAEIKDWLGHEDSKMVALYRHLRPDESQRRMERLDFVGEGSRAVRSARTG